MGCSNQSSSLGLLAPESLGVALGAVVDLAVFFERLDVRALAEFRGRGDGLFFQNVRIEFQHFVPPDRSARRPRLPSPALYFDMVDGIAGTYLMGAGGGGQEQP